MKIDDAVEDSFREIVASTVAGEADRFSLAVGSVADRGDDFSTAALDLAFAVGRIALYLVHGQQWPDDARLAELAESFESNQTWAEVGAADALDILRSLIEGAPHLDPEKLGTFGFALFGVAAWLVTGFEHPEGMTWSDVLDGIEHEIELEPSEDAT